MKFFVFVATIAIAGCGDSGSRVSESTKVQPLLEAHWDGSQEALRVRVDATRNRLWVLGLDRVDVYDIAKKHLVRRIALPGWSVAEFICQPDMALDRSGTAFISHNVQPRLWQIDADSFELKEHAIRLLDRERWEIGFGGLAFAPDGALFGVSASGGSLWSIDIGKESAHQVELDAPALDACAVMAPARGVAQRQDLQ